MNLGGKAFLMFGLTALYTQGMDVSQPFFITEASDHLTFIVAFVFWFVWLWTDDK